MPEPLADRFQPNPVVSSETAFAGRIWDVASQRVDLGGAGTVTREYVRHPGAVGVLALDEQGRAVLIQQYRHPIGGFDWEIPAGLLDVAGEDPWAAARRELSEEADLTAATWHTLLDLAPSPGGSSERIRIYLARDLAPVPAEDRFVRSEEEADMPIRRVPVRDALVAALAGDITNAALIAGLYAADQVLTGQAGELRPADCPWPPQVPA